MLLEYRKASQGRIVLAGLIDAALTIGFFACLFSQLQQNVLISNHPNGWLFSGFILYRFFTILFFNSTLGMKVFKLIFLTADEERLNLKEKILASIFILFKGVDYYQKN